ncbi:MAG: hypothetical protein AAF211_04425 [Myxococcota bacterium]
MGHAFSNSSRLFLRLTYGTKTTEEVREAMTKKLDVLRTRIDERDERMKRIREQYRIDAERLALLVMRFKEDAEFVSYDRQGAAPGEALIPAGVIANLVREREMIDAEQDQIDKISLVLRNLRDQEPYVDHETGELRYRACVHDLGDDELEYLGF